MSSKGYSHASHLARTARMITAAQSFIHVSPAVLVGGAAPHSTLGRLRIELSRFPGLIGHSTSRVSRRINQDAYSLSLLRNEVFASTPLLHMGVYDGHGSVESVVSAQLAAGLPRALANSQDNVSKRLFFELLRRYRDQIGGEYWGAMYRDRAGYYDRFIAHCNTKQELVLFDTENRGSRMLFDHSGNLIDKNSLLSEQQRLCIIAAYLQFDLEQCCGIAGYDSQPDLKRLSELHPGGSTASTVLLSRFDPSSDGTGTGTRLDPTDQSYFVQPSGLLKLIVTQVGDSKVLICDSNGIAHNLSRPHHADQTREYQRLIHGTRDRRDLLSTDAFGEERFLSNFANTRSFGDIPGKQEGISAEPDIYSYLVGNTRQLPHSEKAKLQFGGDECFVAIVTDGVSDVLSDQEICDLVTSTVNLRGLKTATPQYLADEVVKFVVSVADRHADNATCLILRLSNWGNWPTVDRTGASREQKLLAAL